MASRELVLVCFDIASDFFGGMFVHEADGAFVGRGAVGCGDRCGLFPHGGTDGVFGMVWRGIKIGVVGFLMQDGILSGREGALQLALLSLDGKVLLQNGGQVRSHAGGNGLAAGTLCCCLRIGEGGQLLGRPPALADKDGELCLGAVGLIAARQRNKVGGGWGRRNLKVCNGLGNVGGARGVFIGQRLVLEWDDGEQGDGSSQLSNMGGGEE